MYPHPHFTRNVPKKNPQNDPHFTQFGARTFAPRFPIAIDDVRRHMATPNSVNKFMPSK